jgi:hypothetical protein
MIFVIPWREFSLIGATDTDFNGDLERLHATGDEVTYLLDEVRKVLPDARVAMNAVVYTYAGVRPLSYEKGKRESDVSRAHKVVAEERGRFLSITGTKLTCFRSLAENLGDQVMHTLGRRGESRSARIALDGTDDEAPTTEAARVARRLGRGGGHRPSPRHARDAGDGVRPRLDARARPGRQGRGRQRAALPLEPGRRRRAAPRGAGRDGGLAAGRDAATHRHRHQPLPGAGLRGVLSASAWRSSSAGRRGGSTPSSRPITPTSPARIGSASSPVARGESLPRRHRVVARSCAIVRRTWHG